MLRLQTEDVAKLRCLL